MKETSKNGVSDSVFDHGPDHVSLQANSERTETYELSVAFGPKTGKSQLGVDFQPSDLSVICGRGRHRNHSGNHRFGSCLQRRYHDSPGGWTFLQVRKWCMVRSWRSLRARKGERFLPRHVAYSIPIILQGQGHTSEGSKPKEDTNPTVRPAAGRRQHRALG
jgi:hypothetical protein